MKGSIRAAVGFVMAFGAVGGLDDPANSLLIGCAIAAAGLVLMYFGIRAMTN